MSDVSMNTYCPQYPQSSQGGYKKMFGGMIAGGLIGMNAYYLPLNKKAFAEKAFDIHKNEINGQIAALRNAADEISKEKLSTNSKLILQEHGLAEDIVQIGNRCIVLDHSITNETDVKNYKKIFEDGFAAMKKEACLRNNEASQAFKELKRSKFWWGTGIGAVVGLALCLIASRD